MTKGCGPATECRSASLTARTRCCADDGSGAISICTDTGYSSDFATLDEATAACAAAEGRRLCTVAEAGLGLPGGSCSTGHILITVVLLMQTSIRLS